MTYAGLFALCLMLNKPPVEWRERYPWYHHALMSFLLDVFVWLIGIVFWRICTGVWPQ